MYEYGIHVPLAMCRGDGVKGGSVLDDVIGLPILRRRSSKRPALRLLSWPDRACLAGWTAASPDATVLRSPAANAILPRAIRQSRLSARSKEHVLRKQRAAGRAPVLRACVRQARAEQLYDIRAWLAPRPSPFAARPRAEASSGPARSRDGQRVRELSPLLANESRARRLCRRGRVHPQAPPRYWMLTSRGAIARFTSGRSKCLSTPGISNPGGILCVFACTTVM
jgi:hypothetical protein